MRTFITSRSAWLFAPLLAAVAVYGCSDDEGETTSTSTTTNGSSSSSSTSGSGGSGGSSACFEASGGYGGFGEVCMDQAGDNACITCVRAGCCTEVTDCQTDGNCSCLLQCFLDDCDPIECLQLCGQSDQVNALTQCASTSCGNECVQ